MLPFCGYNMADYFAHWLEIGRRADAAKLPRLFYVNWFRKGPDGKFLWPGYGENSRVLEWVFERCAGQGSAERTPIGLVPAVDGIAREGLAVTAEGMADLLEVDRDEWRGELQSIATHFDSFGERLPTELLDELARLEKRLG
jgi:phosphoenolpyruvate carboxykinase (GTP)